MKSNKTHAGGCVTMLLLIVSGCAATQEEGRTSSLASLVAADEPAPASDDDQGQRTAPSPEQPLPPPGHVWIDTGVEIHPRVAVEGVAGHDKDGTVFVTTDGHQLQVWKLWPEDVRGKTVRVTGRLVRRWSRYPAKQSQRVARSAEHLRRHGFHWSCWLDDATWEVLPATTTTTKQ